MRRRLLTVDWRLDLPSIGLDGIDDVLSRWEAYARNAGVAADKMRAIGDALARRRGELG